ncbi:MAG: FtsX-like permease family protein [Kurthia sp.]|nr:FtsX-like permease family protein [Candidatus Kurthia equi]
MTLFDLAKKNIARNFSQYYLYIASMVLSIVIYFTFATMKYSDVIINEAQTSKKIASIMSTSSVILLIFVVVFIFYSNSFFIKKRKKEVGLYSLLGVRKKQIGFMLFFENLLLGLISLIIGIFIGILASKIFIYILLKLMDYEAIATMTVSSEAILNTILIFGSIFIITSLQGYRVVYRFKLIELFHAAKQGEKIPKPNIFIVLVGVTSIYGAYAIALADLLTSKVWSTLGLLAPIVIIGLTILGTYLIFHSLASFFLSLGKKIESFAWKNLRLVTISQLLYRIRANARTLTIIATLSATTITAGGAVFGLYYNTKDSVLQADPHTYMYEENKNNQQEKINELTKNAQYKFSFPMLWTTFDANEIKDSFGPYGERSYAVISEKQYNQLASKLQIHALNLKKDEAWIIDPSYDKRFSPEYKNKTIMAENNNITFRGVKKQSVLNVAIGYTVVVVSEEKFSELKKVSEEKIIHVIGQADADKEAAKKVKNLLPEDVVFSSQQIDLNESMSSIGVLLFVGSFLGLVFLAATGSIIYFKVLTEAEEDKQQFMMLHKMGVSLKEMKKSIAAQVGVIFFIPLLVGIIHSIIALKALSKLLMLDIFSAVVIWMAIYTFIYAVYYGITYKAYTKIIKHTIRNEEG